MIQTVLQELLYYIILMEKKDTILAPDKLQVGDIVQSGPEADIKPGNALKLSDIPVGTIVHNIELQPGKGGQLARNELELWLSYWLKRANMLI